jgi:hypothetical protein
MSSQYLVALNIKQNRPNFALKLIKEQPPIFKFKYYSKTLNKLKGY